MSTLISIMQAANENTYNKMIEVLFNQNQKEVYDFYMKDQTQEGTATNKLKNGRQSVGSLDLLVLHQNDPISIVEGIKISSIDKNNIKNHIQKIFGYNYMNVNIVFFVIYADCEDFVDSWKKYYDYLFTLKESEEFSAKIIEVVVKEEIELFQKNIYKADYVCMTKHIFQEKEMHMYHIMVDIKKVAQKREAENSHR